MSITNNKPVSFDPYSVEIRDDPYPIYKRLREEAPLYYNEEYDFYAVSRFADVVRGLGDHGTFISGRGGILEIIKANIQMPPGTFIFEDPPIHTAHRSLVSRVFTPKKMAALEPRIREFCARSLDPYVGTGGFDFILNLGAEMPMRVIGMLLGIPDEDLEKVRQGADDNLRTEPGKPMEFDTSMVTGDFFADYVEWRSKHPSNDLMTELLNAEFVDEKGVKRRLTRDEVLIYVAVIAGAGNETTNRLIGWIGKVLSDYPDQRAELVANPALIPQAVEEILRFEPPGPTVGRYVAKDVELYGKVVPEGSVMLFNVASANRDEERFPDGGRFNIHREGYPHITFGHGVHTCLGAALARIEGVTALDEVLKRFPKWTVDMSKSKLSSTSTVRGWDTLPVTVP